MSSRDTNSVGEDEGGDGGNGGDGGGGGDGGDSGGVCFLCLEPSTASCSHCAAEACCQDHLRIHRPEEYCFPFRIRFREEVGRYVEATRDIAPLEVIMEDEPAVYGPEHDTVPVCLECLERVDGSYLCPLCELPLCGEKCFQQRKYHKAECEVFSAPPSGRRLEVVFDADRTTDNGGGGDGDGDGDGDPTPYAPEYCCITPLRLLSVRDADPAAWARVQLLMDHDGERRREERYWAMFQRNVVDFLLDRVGLRDRFAEEEVFRAIGILRTNAFFVEDERLKNVIPGQKVQVRSQVAIPRGQEVTIQYISFMYGHLRRRKDIRDCWFFDCRCHRCRDPEELGSRMSAHRCEDAPGCDGDVLPAPEREEGSGDGGEVVDPLEADWRCTGCGKARSAESLREFIEQCQRILHSVDRGSDVLKYEKILQLFLRKLKPTHYLVLTVKKFLGDLYGLTTGFTYRELNRERFENKIDYMRDFIDVVSKVDPGYTKWRGLALHTLLRPVTYKANGTFRSGEITKEEFVGIIKEVCEQLKECIKCLDCESEGTKEAEVAALAKDDLSKLGDLVLFSQYL